MWQMDRILWIRTCFRLMLVIFFLALLVLTPSGTLQGHKVRSGDCSDHNPLLSGKDVSVPPDFEFRWESSASSKQRDDGKWCYDRYVLNNHGKNPLRFDWPVANIGSKTGLPPASQKPFNLIHVNFLWDSGPSQPRDGFLTYGVDQTPEPTRVFLTPEEAARSPSNQSTTASLFMASLDEAGKPLRIDLTLKASFSENKRLTYGFESRSGDPTFVYFQPITKRDFYDAAIKNLGRAWDFGKPLPLQEGSLSVAFLSERGALEVIAPIRFFTEKGTEIAYVSAPTIVSVR